MERTANIGRDLIGLDRIVAGLFVLAGLAEDAAAAHWPVRCAMLWLLRQAHARVEAFAGRYVFWTGLPSRPVLVPLDGDDPAAALSIAQSLRVLASIIAGMILRLRRRQFLFGRQPAAPLSASPQLGIAKLRRLPASVTASPDTS